MTKIPAALVCDMKRHYDILTAYDIDGLCRAVWKAMDQGWEPLGGVTQITTEPYSRYIERDGKKIEVPVGSGRRYAQTVWLPSKPQKKSSWWTND